MSDRIIIAQADSDQKVRAYRVDVEAFAASYEAHRSCGCRTAASCGNRVLDAAGAVLVGVRYDSGWRARGSEREAFSSVHDLVSDLEAADAVIHPVSRWRTAI